MPWTRPLLSPGKADLIPVEILSEIFLLVVGNGRLGQMPLMLVCRRWHAIVLSTPGIHSRLTIRRATQKEAVQQFMQSRKSRLDVRVDMNDETDGSHFNTDNFHECFMAAAQAASRWSSLSLISPPPHGEYKHLQILQPLVHLETVIVDHGFGRAFQQIMTAISRGTSPSLTTMHLGDPAAVLYLVQPACLHITHSLTTLSVELSKRMASPVDILPHLPRLEHFDARNLCLPIYPPDSRPPFTLTLRFLELKSVSVQWMAGHVFPALGQCFIIFPHHADTIQGLQPISMPSCSDFLYHSNDLHPLAQFHLPSLEELNVKSGQWNIWRGNPQLAAICPVVAARAKSLTTLHLDVECSEQLLVYMLSLVPALRLLLLGLAHPDVLSTTFFQAFIVREPNADHAYGMVGPPSQVITPLCPSMSSLGLHYKRWLRGQDKTALIAAFGDIVASRNPERTATFTLSLHIDAPEPGWLVDDPSQPIGEMCFESGIILGISTSHGIIPMSTELPRNGLVPLPFREVDYLRLCDFDFRISFDFLLTRDHMELMVYDNYQPPLPTCALPLFDALRVLVVENANPSFMAGHTFHKLERCRVVKSPKSSGSSPSLFTETEMPACTRADIDDPYLLATFKLPRIHELALDFSHPDCSIIWEKHIAVNVNLSGLNLLHMKNWPFDGDMIPILRTLPSLETLIISSQQGVVSFRAFLPMNANGTSGPKQTSSEGQTLALLCPKLLSLQIEWEVPSMQPELVPILEDVVTLRAERGSPLKTFTFSNFLCEPGSKLELIERDGSFTMKIIDLDEEYEDDGDEEEEEDGDDYAEWDEEAGGFKLDI